MTPNKSRRSKGRINTREYFAKCAPTPLREWCKQNGVTEDDPRLAEIAKPSDYGIKPLSHWIALGHREVYLHCRTSTLQQQMHQIALGAHRHLRFQGVKVRYTFKEPDTSGKEICRKQLLRALRKAAIAGIPLIFIGISRILRSFDYDPQERPDEAPTVAEFEAFMELVRDIEARFGKIKLGTLNDADASPKQDEVFIRDPIVARFVKLRPTRNPNPAPGPKLPRQRHPRLNRMEIYLKCFPILKREKLLHPDDPNHGFPSIRITVQHETRKKVSHVTLGKWWERYLKCFPILEREKLTDPKRGLFTIKRIIHRETGLTIQTRMLNCWWYEHSTDRQGCP